MMRIQGSKMGYADFQKPIIRNFGLGDFQAPRGPRYSVSTELSLAAGSPSGGGGADGGGGAPAPAPAPGGEVPVVSTPPVYLFPVQEPTPPPMPMPPTPTEPTSTLPTWALVGGGLVAGLAIGAYLLK